MNNNDIKIVFVDIDWTILNHSKRPSRYDMPSIRALKKAQKKGIKVFINTARPYHSVDQIRFFNYFKPDGLILGNGNLVTYQDIKIFSSDIPINVFEHICEVANKNDLNLEGIRHFDCFLINNNTKCAEKLFATYPEDMPKVEDYHHQETIGINLFAPIEYDEIIKKEVPEDYVYFRYHDYGVDIAPPPHDKGAAIKMVLEYLGLSRDNAMAIGDDIADIAMFEHVKYGIAMANGKEETIKTATHVTKHISKHGVKHILKELVF